MPPDHDPAGVGAPRPPARARVAIIGGGAGGLAMAAYLQRVGVDDLVILEKGPGVGGTWRTNTYPGAACDVPSHLYSFGFAPNPDWSRTYAGQAEILAYFEDVADRLGLRDRIVTDTGVAEAVWDAGSSTWDVRTERGDHVRAQVVVSAVGLFNAIAWPSLPGLGDFAGPVMHSAQWDHDVDLDSRRVAVVGTGASSIQIVPELAKVAAHLDVYQRSAPWIMPRGDAPFSDEQRQRFAEVPLEARRQRHGVFRFFEDGTLLRLDDPMHAAFESFSRKHIEASVPEGELRDAVTPDYPIGCKRILISDDYYPALLEDHVDLVTSPIERVVADGIDTADGEHHPADVLVLATGFRATAYLHGLEVVGRDGRRLQDEWAKEPRAYRGVAVSGYPNFFVLYGPNTNQGGNSILYVLEAQARHVSELVKTMDAAGARVVEVRAEAQDAYNDHLAELFEGTVWTGGCGSYFLTESGHNATQMPYKASEYRRSLRRPDLDDYELTGT